MPQAQRGPLVRAVAHEERRSVGDAVRGEAHERQVGMPLAALEKYYCYIPVALPLAALEK